RSIPSARSPTPRRATRGARGGRRSRAPVERCGRRRVRVAGWTTTRRDVTRRAGAAPAGSQYPPAMRMRIGILVVGLVLAAPSLARAEIEIRKGGSSWAVVEDDGTVRIGGSSVGKVEKDGTVRKDGSSVGNVESDGTIRRGGSSIGQVDTDGTVRKSGSGIGKIENDGGIRKGGSSWGSASHCCGDHGSKRTVAAVLAFFSG